MAESGKGEALSSPGELTTEKSQIEVSAPEKKTDTSVSELQSQVNLTQREKGTIPGEEPQRGDIPHPDKTGKASASSGDQQPGAAPQRSEDKDNSASQHEVQASPLQIGLLSSNVSAAETKILVKHIKEGIKQTSRDQRIQNCVANKPFFWLAKDGVSAPKLAEFEVSHTEQGFSFKNKSSTLKILELNKEAAIAVNKFADSKLDSGSDAFHTFETEQMASKLDAAVRNVVKYNKKLQVIHKCSPEASKTELSTVLASLEKIEKIEKKYKEAKLKLETLTKYDRTIVGCLDRLSFCVFGEKGNAVRLLIVCWHGPHIIYEVQKLFVLKELVSFVDKLATHYEANVAIIEGDFNLPTGEAEQALKDVSLARARGSPEIIACSDYKTPNKEENTALKDYLIVWPARCVKVVEMRQIPVPRNEEIEMEPFDHPQILYILEVTEPSEE